FEAESDHRACLLILQPDSALGRRGEDDACGPTFEGGRETGADPRRPRRETCRDSGRDGRAGTGSQLRNQLRTMAATAGSQDAGSTDQSKNLYPGPRVHLLSPCKWLAAIRWRPLDAAARSEEQEKCPSAG